MPKKPKLTPEEKKKLREEKKIAKKLAIAEGKRQLKRDELTRELKYGEISKKKLGAKWKEMLMEIKLPVLKTELQLAINNADLIMDTKDFIISLLLDELDEAEEQYTFNFRQHCENIQNIYNIYLSRLHQLKKEYDDELLFLRYSLHQQSENIRSNSENAETYIKTMTYALNVQEKQLENMGRSLYMSKQNEQESKYKDETNFKRKKCEDIFENVWKSFTDYLENYTAQIKETEKDYEERTNRDNSVVKIIKKQTEEIFQQVNLLRIIKDRQIIQHERFSTKIKDLNDEKDVLQNIFVTLRNAFLEDVKYDEKILTSLVVESTKQITEMESTAELAEKILKLYSIVRKFETRREKILPFPKKQPRKIKHENYWGNLKSLSHFWQKCAMADTARNNVNDEYLHLLEENYGLRNAVKACIYYNCNRKAPPVTKVQKKIVLGHCNSTSNIVHRL